MKDVKKRKKYFKYVVLLIVIVFLPVYIFKIISVNKKYREEFPQKNVYIINGEELRLGNRNIRIKEALLYKGEALKKFVKKHHKSYGLTYPLDDPDASYTSDNIVGLLYVKMDGIYKVGTFLSSRQDNRVIISPSYGGDFLYELKKTDMNDLEKNGVLLGSSLYLINDEKHNLFSFTDSTHRYIFKLTPSFIKVIDKT